MMIDSDDDYNSIKNNHGDDDNGDADSVIRII